MKHNTIVVFTRLPSNPLPAGGDGSSPPIGGRPGGVSPILHCQLVKERVSLFGGFTPTGVWRFPERWPGKKEPPLKPPLTPPKEGEKKKRKYLE